MTKPTLYWHIHHEILLEETTDIQERIDYIRTNKPEKEIPLRLKLMTPVLHPEKLPARFRRASEACFKAWEALGKESEAYYKASKAYDKAREAYDKAWEAYDKAAEAYYNAWEVYIMASKAYDKARKARDKEWKACEKARKAYDKARKAYDKARKAYAPQIEKLHREEHPDCPWNGKTIFSEVD